jgi:predicted nucleotide-binding protein (sugar kinase/HSP70/actin superfamily)
MGVVRIDDKLIKDIQKWLGENGHKYKFPTLSAFVNNAVYEKLKELKSKKKGV